MSVCRAAVLAVSLWLGASLWPGGLAPCRAGEVVAVETSAVAVCPGDCDGNYRVSVSELIQGVNIALDRVPVASCAAVDADLDGRVTIGELVRAVGNALGVCACPFDFATSSLEADVACVYQGRWNDVCGDASLQATFAGDGTSLGVAVVAGGGPPIAFLSVVADANTANLAGYAIGDETVVLPGLVSLAEDRSELRIAPSEAAELIIRDCPFTGYDGRLVEVVTLP
jgi:hypothetical protein